MRIFRGEPPTSIIVYLSFYGEAQFFTGAGLGGGLFGLSNGSGYGYTRLLNHVYF